VIRVNATDLDILENANVTYTTGSGGEDNFIITPEDGTVYVSSYPDLVVDHPPKHYNLTVSRQR